MPEAKGWNAAVPLRCTLRVPASVLNAVMIDFCTTFGTGGQRQIRIAMSRRASLEQLRQRSCERTARFRPLILARDVPLLFGRSLPLQVVESFLQKWQVRDQIAFGLVVERLFLYLLPARIGIPLGPGALGLGVERPA